VRTLLDHILRRSLFSTLVRGRLYVNAPSAFQAHRSSPPIRTGKGRHALTFEDPDGFRVVLAATSWTPDR
jgi:hypothetical protein